MRSVGGEEQRNPRQKWAKHFRHEIDEARRSPPAAHKAAAMSFHGEITNWGGTGYESGNGWYREKSYWKRAKPRRTMAAAELRGAAVCNRRLRVDWLQPIEWWHFSWSSQAFRAAI